MSPTGLLVLYWRPVVAWLNMAVWVFALTQPAYFRVFEYFEGAPVDPNSIETTSGLDCLAFGWLAPVGVLRSPEFGHALPPSLPMLPYLGLHDWSFANVAWYANLLWAWNFLRLIAGDPVRAVPAIGSAVVSLCALQSFYMNFGDDHGVATMSSPGPAAYIWAATMSVPLVALAIETLVKVHRAERME